MPASTLWPLLPVLYPLWNEPPAIISNAVSLCAYHKYLEKGLVFVDIVGGFGWICSFFTACPRVVTLAALQTAAVFSLFFHDYRASRTVQTALQTATAVVSSHELASSGNGGRT